MTDNTTITVPRNLALRLTTQANAKGLSKVALLRSLIGVDDLPVEIVFAEEAGRCDLMIDFATMPRFTASSSQTRELAKHMARIAGEGGALFDCDVGLSISRKGAAVILTAQVDETSGYRQIMPSDVAKAVAEELAQAADEADGIAARAGAAA